MQADMSIEQMAGEHNLPHAPAEDFQHGVTDHVQVCHAGIVVKFCKQMGIWKFSHQKSALYTFMAMQSDI